MVGMITVSVLITIGLRVAETVLYDTQRIFIAHRSVDFALDSLQVADVVLSLLTNIFSTSIIGVKAWSASSLFLTFISSDLVSVGVIDTGSHLNFS